MQKFNILREKYKEFIYKDFEIREENNNIIIKYFFEIPGLTKFEPIITIEKRNINFNSIEDALVKNMVFNLGMVEAISYWKSVCAEKLIVECGNLDSKQIEFFKKLFYLGLGEFRYINNIKIDEKDFIEIISKGVGADAHGCPQYNEIENSTKSVSRKSNSNRRRKRLYGYVKPIR